MNYLVDTNIISELIRKKPNHGVLEWAGQVKLVGISSVIVEEIMFGLSYKPNSKILFWFEEFIKLHCQVLPVTESIARRSGELRGKLRTKGVSRTQADMFIASTALEYGLSLVSRNTRDFEGCGVSLLNPFQ